MKINSTRTYLNNIYLNSYFDIWINMDAEVQTIISHNDQLEIIYNYDERIPGTKAIRLFRTNYSPGDLYITPLPNGSDIKYGTLITDPHHYSHIFYQVEITPSEIRDRKLNYLLGD